MLFEGGSAEFSSSGHKINLLSLNSMFNMNLKSFYKEFDYFQLRMKVFSNITMNSRNLYVIGNTFMTSLFLKGLSVTTRLIANHIRMWDQA